MVIVDIKPLFIKRRIKKSKKPKSTKIKENNQWYKGRVCIDDGTDFVLYKKEIYRFNLEVGQVLQEEKYQEILNEIFIKRARKRAMNLVLKMDRSENDLRIKLKASGYPKEAVDDAIEYMYKFHYIDDLRLAKNFVRYYEYTKSISDLTMKLTKMGIKEEYIEEALSNELKLSEEDKILSILSKRKYYKENADEKEKAKQYRYLISKGFKTSDIMKFL